MKQESVRLLFDYDCDTGILTRKTTVSWNAEKGSEAGSINGAGYRALRIDGSHYLVHRIIWLWQYGDWPQFEIDHINNVRTDNRLINLRDVTHGENQQNRIDSKYSF